MSVILFDGFDSYPNVTDTSDGAQSVWITGNSYNEIHIVTPGRFGGQCILFEKSVYGGQATMEQFFANTNTATVGFAFQIQTDIAPASVNQALFALTAGGSNSPYVAGVGVTTSRQLYIYLGNNFETPVVTGGPMLTPLAWHTLEFEFSLDASAGFATAFLDGIQVATFTGNTGTSPINNFTLNTNPNKAVSAMAFSVYYDDVYVTNSSTRLGERKVTSQVANSDVSVNWTPSTGSINYSLINTIPVPASPTTYVYSNAVGAQDLYGVVPLAGDPTAISAVQVRIVAQKDDAVTRVMATTLKSGSTQVSGANTALTASYLHYLQLLNEDPNTSAPWTTEAVNSVEIGQIVIS